MASSKKKSAGQLSEDEILRQAMSRVGGEGGAATEAPAKSSGPTVAPEVPEPKIEDEVAREERAVAASRKRKPTATANEDGAVAPSRARAPHFHELKEGVHTVTYKPRDDGDNFRTVFFGMRFEANIPRETSNMELLKLACTNPWFSVDGKPPYVRVKPQIEEPDEDGLYPGMSIEEAEKKEFDPIELGVDPDKVFDNVD